METKNNQYLKIRLEPHHHHCHLQNFLLYRHDSWEPFSLLVYTKLHINYNAIGYVQVGSTVHVSLCLVLGCLDMK